jgi:hypothetical protein
MAIGGATEDGQADQVELISLDATKYPVPTQLQKLEKFPRNVLAGGGAMLRPGN